jgi:hypothetical protein
VSTPAPAADGSTSATGKIALLTVWFGEWRGWINVHLESCARNPEIVWFFLHDQPALPAHRPANVHFVETSSRDIEQRYLRVIGRPINLPSAYKLCDLKPLLGSLFPELIQNYVWWGYCDTDLIWGDIRRFITDDDLARYDVISSHVCAILGQFSIFRGGDLPRRLVEQIPDVAGLFADTTYRGIDELLIDQAARAAETKGEIKVSRRMLQVWERLYQPSWEKWASDLETARLGRPVEVSFLTGPCEWREGRMFHQATNTETMFFHFLEWKRVWRMPLYPWPLPEMEKLVIDERGFHFTFREADLYENFALILRHEIPFLLWRHCAHYFAKAGRARAKLFRRLRRAD